MIIESRKYLFGGEKEWSKGDWTASDDRVRGGASTSYLEIKSSPTKDPIEGNGRSHNTTGATTSAVFYGNLDVTTLGGAGFASQRTAKNTLEWNLSEYDGIELQIGKSDGKRYAFVLKDEILPKRPDGRERSSLNWEYEFVVPSSETMREEGSDLVHIRWKDFLPTYRGRLKENPGCTVDVAAIQRVTIMMRSFFGYQDGDFELEIKSIAAFKDIGEKEQEEAIATIPGVRNAEGQLQAEIMGEKQPSRRGSLEELIATKRESKRRSFFARFCLACCC